MLNQIAKSLDTITSIQKKASLDIHEIQLKLVAISKNQEDNTNDIEHIKETLASINASFVLYKSGKHTPKTNKPVNLGKKAYGCHEILGINLPPNDNLNELKLLSLGSANVVTR